MVIWGVAFIWSLALPIAVEFGGINLPLYRVFLIISLVPAFLNIVKTPGKGLGAVDLFLLLNFIWVFVAMSVNHPMPSIIESTGSYFLEAIAAFWLGKAACSDRKDFIRIFKHVSIILILIFPFVLIQSVTGKNIILDVFRHIFPILPPSMESQRLGLFRAHASFPHPILFGVFASFSIALTVLTFKRLKFVSIPIMGLSTFFSLSTGPLLIMVLQIIFLTWNALLSRMKSRWWVFLICFLVTYAVVDVLSNRTPFHVFVDYMTLNSGSAYNRILIWEFGTAEVARHPIFGIGFNDWNNPGWMSDSMDNFWLVLAVRYGLPGFLFFFAAFLTIFIKACRRRFPGDPRTAEIRLGWCLSLLAISIAGTTVHFFGAVFPLFLFMWGTGAWFYERQPVRRGRRAPAVAPAEDVRDLPSGEVARP
ncbi:O-antigen ligase family protein [Algihabitans albus]|uniref:O-antigen ligase family protein n=1 Tax=Algihabitans albus TaxID=2164067 RepID=UPI000E5D6BF6|nr:O-antigen ligase family protein [Algihabitans albus]